MTAFDVDEFVTALDAALIADADSDVAAGMAKYMRNQFPFLGVKTPVRRAAMKHVLAECDAPTQQELANALRALWKREEREFQYVGVDLARRWIKHCDSSFLPHLKHAVVTKSWWDTVDSLAIAIGSLVARDPALVAVMDDWIDDRNVWLARVAILHQLDQKSNTDAERLFGYCERRASDENFFIRKAIGWALRQYARTDARAVHRFVHEHESVLSALSRREALKHQ